MQISFFQAFLIGVVYYLGNIGTPWLSLLDLLFGDPLRLEWGATDGAVGL